MVVVVVGGVLPLCRETVIVLYNPSQLSTKVLEVLQTIESSQE